MKFVVIGITDHPQPWFSPEVMDVIHQGKVFSGGKRHHELVAEYLPDGAEWIDITVPLGSVFEQYAHLPLSSEGDGGRSLIVFASGDPLFFGFANTLRREFPDAGLVVYPTFNSLQMLAHRLLMPYHDMRIVSLTGRPWPEFDRALIERASKIGILTDREHTPAAIARRMLDYGYTYYNIYIGEHLGHPTEERITTTTLNEAATMTFAQPNCVILSECPVSGDLLPECPVSGDLLSDCPVCDDSVTAITLRPFGIPDSDFALLDGREKMITKMPIRLLTLQALDLPRRHVLWDVGACTGSVSIEARLQFPHLQIEAFEIRPECEAIIKENARRHHAPGINVHIGDFMAFCPSPSQGGAGGESSTQGGAGGESPDAVFIGGHGGRLKEIMQKVLCYLAPDGIIVMNSVVAPKVTTDSHRLWDEACRDLGLQQEPPLHIQLNDHHPITILKCRR